MKKRVLPLILAMACAVGLVPATAHAADEGITYSVNSEDVSIAPVYGNISPEDIVIEPYYNENNDYNGGIAANGEGYAIVRGAYAKETLARAYFKVSINGEAASEYGYVNLSADASLSYGFEKYNPEYFGRFLNNGEFIYDSHKSTWEYDVFYVEYEMLKSGIVTISAEAEIDNVISEPAKFNIIMPGDANRSGNVNSMDAAVISDYFENNSVPQRAADDPNTTFAFELADLNLDGTIILRDMIWAIRLSENTEPVEWGYDSWGGYYIEIEGQETYVNETIHHGDIIELKFDVSSHYDNIKALEAAQFLLSYDPGILSPGRFTVLSNYGSNSEDYRVMPMGDENSGEMRLAVLSNTLPAVPADYDGVFFTINAEFTVNNENRLMENARYGSYAPAELRLFKNDLNFENSDGEHIEEQCAGYIHLNSSPARIKFEGYHPHYDYSVNIRTYGGGRVHAYHMNAVHNETVTIRTIPDRGYQVSNVVVRSRYSGTIYDIHNYEEDWMFVMPGEDVDVEVTFEPKSGYKTVTVYGAAYAKIGDEEFITAAESGEAVEILPYSGVEITGMEVKDSDGNIVPHDESTFTFTMPDSDVIVELELVEKPLYTLTYENTEFVQEDWYADTEVDLTYTIPEKDGFIFTGWYSDPELTNKITSIIMDSNKTVYAGWEEASPAPKFVVSDASIYGAEEIAVPVLIENNSGIVSAEISVGFDEEILEWTGVERGDFGGQFDARLGAPITWFASNGTVNETKDGTFAILKFKAKPGIGRGKLYDVITNIFVSYEPDNVFDCDYENVYFNTVDGEIIVEAYSLGDVNADRVLDAKDKTILNRYLAGWEGYESKIINRDAADINGDGTINNRDKTILNRCLAGWEGYDEYFIRN